jgi:hypothetical protein
MNRSNTQVAADAVDTVGDAFGDITHDLADLAEAAVAVAAVSGRVGLRIVSRTVRLLARHPREALAGIVVVTVMVAAIKLVRSSSTSRSSSRPSSQPASRRAN